MGFRPFFLGAAFAGTLMIPLWVASFAGYMTPRAALAFTIAYHAHEMVFGFVSAVIAGFLLTASQSWTGRRGIHGAPLAGLFSLWLAARLAAYFAPLNFLWIYTILDVAFFPTLAALLAPYLARADQRKHWIFFVFFALLFAACVLFHLDLHGQLPGWGAASNSLAVYTVLEYLTVVAGRLIPTFTEQAVAGARIRRWPLIERLILPATLSFALIDCCTSLPSQTLPAGVNTMLASVHPLLACILCVAHGVRLSGWINRAKPILWILFAAYGMIACGFALHAIAGLAGFIFSTVVVPPGIALHAFTAGAMGLFIYGMISRVALGHTGRPIHAAPVVVVGYWLMLAAVALRIFGPLIFVYAGDLIGLTYTDVILAAGVAWTGAYLILLVKYAPLLVRPRIDGQPG